MASLHARLLRVSKALGALLEHKRHWGPSLCAHQIQQVHMLVSQSCMACGWERRRRVGSVGSLAVRGVLLGCGEAAATMGQSTCSWCTQSNGVPIIGQGASPGNEKVRGGGGLEWEKGCDSPAQHWMQIRTRRHTHTHTHTHTRRHTHTHTHTHIGKKQHHVYMLFIQRRFAKAAT